jgi:hypothetical protein
MLTRILVLALAAGSLACAAYAQTTPGTGTTGSGGSPTTSPSTAPMTPSTGSSGSSGTMGSTGMTGTGQQAQQPMGTGSFDPTKYKSKTDCLNGATAAHASTSLCNNLK